MRRAALIVALAACRTPAADPAEATPQRAEIAATPSAEVAEARGRSPIKSDERVQLFPTAGWKADDGWHLPIHGWIYEPEEDSWRRAALVEAMAAALGSVATDSETFATRVRPFAYDNERGKVVEVDVAGRVVTLPASGKDGHFADVATLDGATAAGTISITALTRPGDARTFGTTAFLVPPSGLTVISDIDDTVKVSEVTDKEALLRRTFLEPFEVVPGMAAKYREWLEAAPGGHLHFVSASPWQLYPALADMLVEGGFPEASFSLKTLRIKDTQVFEVLASTREGKIASIAEHVERFPTRRFVLVGDSGEFDPEVYGEIARRFGERIVYIAIRNVTGDDPGSARYAAAFADVDARWELFSDPAELPGLRELRGPP